MSIKGYNLRSFGLLPTKSGHSLFCEVRASSPSNQTTMIVSARRTNKDLRKAPKEWACMHGLRLTVRLCRRSRFSSAAIIGLPQMQRQHYSRAARRHASRNQTCKLEACTTNPSPQAECPRHNCRWMQAGCLRCREMPRCWRAIQFPAFQHTFAILQPVSQT